MFDDAMLGQARDLFADLKREKLMIATAESCTGGLIAGLLTEIAGSSAYLERGFVTYSNEAKSACLGVPADLIAHHGAVSEAVARAMAAGALAHSRADVAVAVTGVAGPGGGTPEKPVGLVHVAAQRRGRDALHERLELGDVGRGPIRLETVRRAVALARRAVAA
jgi:nicotinamide-nucleotide amidase